MREALQRNTGSSRRRLLFLVLLALLALLQYRLWFGNGGVVALHHAQSVLDRVTTANDTLHKRNTALAADVTNLAKGGPAIEARARTQLGMIHKGETFYLVVHPRP